MWVFVENLDVLGHHGVYAEERSEGRRFRFDIEAELGSWERHDRIARTLDYRRLVDVVLEVVRGESKQLIETLGWQVADRVFAQYDVTRLKLRIRKKAPDVLGDPDWVGAAFDLTRSDWEALLEA